MKWIILMIIIFSCSLLFSFFNKNNNLDLSKLPKSIYDYSFNHIDGETVNLKRYQGKKIIIVNVASKCGYTPQYEGLQKLYEQFGNKIEILGFPSNDFLWQEPAENDEIKKFCSTNYGVSFQMFEKSVVKKNKEQNSIYTWLTNKELNGWNDKAPSWNFCKYLINEKGELVKFYPSSIKPQSEEILSFINE